MMNPRLVAIKILVQIIAHGKSLNHCSPQINEQVSDPKDRALARELVFGVLRHYDQLTFVLNHFLQKKLKAKETDITCLLLTGIYQLHYMRIPNHAAVNESVKLTLKLKKNWAKGFVNGVLRQCLREKESLNELISTQQSAKYAHPEWLLKKIQHDWPDNWENIVTQNNQHAPMILRVNRQKITVKDYVQRLVDVNIIGEPMPHAPDAVVLTQACDVSVLPGFEAGLVSVQDSAAQQAAALISLTNDNYVLDACAAPGGKAAHLLEIGPSIELLALELSDKRVPLITKTLARLTLSAAVKCADASNVDSWWDNRLFDRILLDAPCSATGVIRRNPDIKIHRRPEDIDTIVENQKNLLEKLWPLLKPGGILLYATCSILKDENENQIARFVEANDDANEIKLDSTLGLTCKAGIQIFPGEKQMDGFYYARIDKTKM